jgi:hypothetical protein
MGERGFVSRNLHGGKTQNVYSGDRGVQSD